VKIFRLRIMTERRYLVAVSDSWWPGYEKGVRDTEERLRGEQPVADAETTAELFRAYLAGRDDAAGSEPHSGAGMPAQRRVPPYRRGPRTGPGRG